MVPRVGLTRDPGMTGGFRDGPEDEDGSKDGSENEEWL